MKDIKMTSKAIEDYEILIRKRGNNDYAAYCPQLNYMTKGAEHEIVREQLKSYINDYINNLS